LRGADISRVHADLRDIRGENLQTGATGTTRRTEFDAGQSWVFAFGCYGSVYGARTDPGRPPKYSPPSATTAMARPQHPLSQQRTAWPVGWCGGVSEAQQGPHGASGRLGL